MRRFKIIGAAIFAAFLLVGCAALTDIVGDFGGGSGLALLDKAVDGVDKVEDATLGNAGKAIDKYCQHVPRAARSLLRARLNAHASKGSIAITCEGDP